MTLRRIAALLLLAAFAGSIASCRQSPLTAPPVVESAPAPLAGRWVGYYIPEVPTETASLATLETKTGQRAAVSHYFLGVAVESFNFTMADNATSHGAIPMITLEFWDFRKVTSLQPEYRLERITAGAHDAYLRNFARDARAFGHPILLRPLHEMNGSWYPWCGTLNGNAPDDFVGAWRHIHDVFTQEGADNVRLVWCPNAESVPDTPLNEIGEYWPGEAYVDYVALDGYNSGAPNRWRDFGDIFGGGYRDVTMLTNKPLFIAETGCAMVGGDKGAWIEEMFGELSSSYPRVKGVVWFNARKERDWRIESSPQSLAAFREGARGWASIAAVQ